MTLTDYAALLASFLSAAAVGFAILSAVYARWSARAAQRANELAQHNERLMIFKGLHAFNMAIQKQGVAFSDADIGKFSEYVTLSEFYFSPSLYKSMDDIVSSAGAIVNQHIVWRGLCEAKNPTAQKVRKKLGEEFIALVAQCNKVEADIKSNLRLEPNLPSWLI